MTQVSEQSDGPLHDCPILVAYEKEVTRLAYKTVGYLPFRPPSCMTL